LPEKPKSN